MIFPLSCLAEVTGNASLTANNINGVNIDVDGYQNVEFGGYGQSVILVNSEASLSPDGLAYRLIGGHNANIKLDGGNFIKGSLIELTNSISISPNPDDKTLELRDQVEWQASVINNFWLKTEMSLNIGQKAIFSATKQTDRQSYGGLGLSRKFSAGKILSGNMTISQDGFAHNKISTFSRGLSASKSDERNTITASISTSSEIGIDYNSNDDELSGTINYLRVISPTSSFSFGYSRGYEAWQKFNAIELLELEPQEGLIISKELNYNFTQGNLNLNVSLIHTEDDAEKYDFNGEVGIITSVKDYKNPIIHVINYSSSKEIENRITQHNLRYRASQTLSAGSQFFGQISQSYENGMNDTLVISIGLNVNSIANVIREQ